jgi:uncharacterized Zn finger protein (UPF0148 family)
MVIIEYKGEVMAERPLIEKPCGKCKKPMLCTAGREICSVCRREIEKMNKREKRTGWVIYGDITAKDYKPF